MKYKVALIVPYFGKLPNYFQLFLESCKYNSSYNWFLFTDDRTEYIYPDNVHVTYLDFEELKHKIQNKFDFKISLETAYKLCDYKAAYGYIFEEELISGGYDFWGHCDVDLLFGEITKYVTDEILDKYDKVFYKGHFSLYRNSYYMNRLFMKKINGDLFWIKVLSDPSSFGYDERGIDDKIGMYTIFKQEKIDLYEKPVYASLNITKAHFQLSLYPYDDSDERLNTNSVFIWNKGKIIRLFIRDGKIQSQEYMYLHMQAHPMHNSFKWNAQPDKVLIIPNRIIPFDDSIDKRKLKKWGHKRLCYLYFWKKRFQRIIKRFLIR